MKVVRLTRLVLAGCIGLSILAAQAVALPSVIAGPLVNPANGHSYYMLDHAYWPDADTAATSLGGYLAAINDAAENAWVYETFGPIADNANGSQTWIQLWIGLVDQGNSNWTWTSGEPVAYLNWRPGEPNFGDEDYAVMGNYPDGLGTWNNTWPDNWYPVHHLLTYGVVEVVPEPATMAFLALGGLALIRRRRTT